MSDEARSFIVQLLNRNPRKRMGASEQDAEELKAHPFLAKVDWECVRNCQQEMPEIIPKLHFETNATAQKAFVAGEKESSANMKILYQ